jgi:hypothetical protein
MTQCQDVNGKDHTDNVDIERRERGRDHHPGRPITGLVHLTMTQRHDCPAPGASRAGRECRCFGWFVLLLDGADCHQMTRRRVNQIFTAFAGMCGPASRIVRCGE